EGPADGVLPVQREEGHSPHPVPVRRQATQPGREGRIRTARPADRRPGRGDDPRHRARQAGHAPRVDPKTFILTGGKVRKRPQVVDTPWREPPPAATIGAVFDTYSKTLTPGSKEANSVGTEEVHGRHFRRVLGAGRTFDGLSVDVLQGYVDKRAAEGVVR